MFDINESVHKQKQLQADKIQGLPDKPIQHQEPIQHIDDTGFDVNAEREGEAISRAFKPIVHRLRRTYKQGDDTFTTGHDHRAIGRNW